MEFVYLIILGIITIVLTRFLLIDGIVMVASAWGIPKKTRGQVLGYATSVPELVGTVGTASKGLLGAGLWNIYASNIINLVLFLAAVIYYKQHKRLLQKKFWDEIGFSVGAIIIPFFLVQFGSQATSIWIAGALFVFFISYIVMDHFMNPSSEEEESEEEEVLSDSAIRGIILIVVGLLGVIVLGEFLGEVAESIVYSLNVPQWAVGWILGVLTSLPEMTSFFALFKAGQHSPNDDDCQEALDNLAASNMSNLGLIYPLGILMFLWVTV